MQEVSIYFEPVIHDKEFIDKVCRLIDDSYGTKIISRYIEKGATNNHRVTFGGNIDDIAKVCVAIGIMKVNHISSNRLANYTSGLAHALNGL